MSIFVTWDQVAPTDQQNGVISVYGVFYRPLQTFGGAIKEESVNVTELSVTLTGLEEHVNYSISVRAYTSDEVGLYSEEVTVQTREGGM